MSRSIGPGGRPTGGGTGRRLRADDTLPGVQFPVVDDLNKISADDEFLDAIAAGSADLRGLFAGSGAPANPGSPSMLDGSAGRRPVGLGPLLMAWRSELLEAPLPPLPTLAARPMLAPADRSRRRSMRSLLSVGAAICALLMASTAVGAHSAQPGEPLWGLSTVLWSGHAESVVAKISVQKELDLAVKAVASNDKGQALAALARADAAMGKVARDDGLDDLQRHYTALVQQADKLETTTTGPSPTDLTGTPGNVGGPPSVGAFPLVVATSSKNPAAPAKSSAKPGSTVSSASAGDPAVAAGGGAGPVDTPAQSVSDFPVVPGLPVTTSSASEPAGQGGSGGSGPAAGPGTTADPTTPPAGTTVGTTAPTDPGTSAPVDSSTPTTAAPVTTPDPTDPPSSTPADPTTTADPTSDPSTSDDPTATSDDPTTVEPTTDDPTTDDPPTVSTTSVIPTTLDSTPSTGSDGSTTDDPSTTTVQTAPVNSTDGDTTANDSDDAGYTDDAVAPSGQSGP